MALGDLNPATWRIDVYKMKPENSFGGIITDLSNLYTSDLKITRQRNYPDEIRFTLDLQQLEERAKKLNLTSHDIVEPYRHKIKIYRNNKFMVQGIVTKVTANLNNQSKNTLEVQCVDTLGLLEKRLIHQDYAEGSWADFAKEVIKDAQHEPNRIYNYAWEGDGVSIENVWFRGWKYRPGESVLKDFPDWEPNHLYSMYDTCTHNAKFWEAKEHAFYSGETFSESNWTLLGVLNEETGEVDAAYGVWREDNEKPGPTGTHEGGWGGISSCHMTASSFQVNNAGDVTSISMADSTVSTSLVAPYAADPGGTSLPDGYTQLEYIETTEALNDYKLQGTYFDTGLKPSDYWSQFKVTMDFQMSPSAGTSTWHTLLGAAYGDTNGTWQWNPQWHLAVNDYNTLIMEIPNHATPGSTNYVISTSPMQFNADRHTIVLDMIDPNNLSLTLDGTTFTGACELRAAPDQTLGLLARRYQNPSSYEGGQNGCYAAPGKLYSCQIEDSHGNRLRNFVPCRRDSDNLVGLYDTANGKFYAPKGIGTPTAGTVIPTNPSGEKIHTRVMAKDMTGQNPPTTTIQLYLEGYGGENKLWSPTLAVTEAGWQALEYDFAMPDFAVYRFGIKILSGDAIFDTPLVYKAPVEGDPWDLGITIGTFPSRAEQAEAGWLFDRHTPIYEWKKAKETLLDLSNMDSDNFWYEIDEQNRFNLWINRGSDKVNVALSYPKNITSMEVSTDADALVNYIKGDGSAEVSQDPLISGVVNDNGAPFTWIEYDLDSMNNYWALASAVRYDSERTLESLRQDILSEIATGKDLQSVPTIKISNNAVTPDQIGLGDVVSVEAIDIPYVLPVNGLYKIVSYEIGVDIDGNESLSLTVIKPSENQINSLSFPQLIKNLINRLHGAR